VRPLAARMADLAGIFEEFAKQDREKAGDAGSGIVGAMFSERDAGKAVAYENAAAMLRRELCRQRLQKVVKR